MRKVLDLFLVLFFIVTNSWYFEENNNVVKFLGEGNGTPLQYSCLENPMDGGAW